jgi:hypothetical protein
MYQDLKLQAGCWFKHGTFLVDVAAVTFLYASEHDLLFDTLSGLWLAVLI